MIQLEWISTTITSNQQANNMIRLFNETKPKIGAFDTETNGLHIIMSKPFLFQFGWIDPGLEKGYTFAVDLEKQPHLARAVIKKWNELAKQLDINLAHNVKFDLHMLHNIGLPYEYENLSDTLFYIRYAHDALTPANGGPPLALKDYAARYITPKAKAHEKLLNQEKTSIVKELNAKLKLRLSKCKVPPETFGAKSYTLALVKQIFSDPIMDYTDLPEGLKEAYLDWLQLDVPLYLQRKVTGLVEPDMISYQTLNRDNIIKYAHYDIVWVLEIYLKLHDVVKARHNMGGIEIENKLILPLIEMERTGFKADKEYLNTARKNVKDYIIQQRNRLYNITGTKIGVAQHAAIKQVLLNKFGLEVASTGNEQLELLVSSLKRSGEHPEAIEFIELVQELRTLEKWYSTYIMRFIKDLQSCDRLYTTINQVGTVSGRVTSDFQQFPKKPIKTTDGVELFHPRRVVQKSGGDYEGIIYLDYSQVELRFQALYTILCGEPDLNLCRAYMPYKCVNPKGEVFDYNNPEHIKNWNKEWYYQEDPKKHWEPTDVHAATTIAATGLSPDDPAFKLARYDIGKRVNFAKNYGASLNRIITMFPEKTLEECKRIDGAYYTAFPGVKAYHQYCYDRAQTEACTCNLFGINYYGVSGHKLINLLIQGSAAFYLKKKIRELYEYSKEHHVHSRFQMQIHDELSWEYHKDDPLDLFFEYKHIMEDWSDTLVPIVAEMDATKSAWADKKGIDSLEELKAYFES